MTALLLLLAERERHGYELVEELPVTSGRSAPIPVASRCRRSAPAAAPRQRNPPWIGTPTICAALDQGVSRVGTPTIPAGRDTHTAREERTKARADPGCPYSDVPIRTSETTADEAERFLVREIIEGHADVAAIAGWLEGVMRSR